MPGADVPGSRAAGLAHLVHDLPQERLNVAVPAVASAEAVPTLTVEHVTDRTALGRPVGSSQHSRFVPAEPRTEVTIARTYVDGHRIEYRVAEAGRDSRVQSVHGGTTEIMTEIIGRSMGL